MSRLIAFIVTAAAGLVVAPSVAQAASCGTVKGVGNATSVTGVKTSTGSCVSAKTVAKSFARSRTAPRGYTCKERLKATASPPSAAVTCTRKARRITFRVTWRGALPLPAAAAPPSANAG